MRKGSEFEAAIVEYLSSKTAVLTVAQSRDEIRDLAAAEQTIEALAEGRPIVHQAVLRDPETLTYGAADLLIRSYIFSDLFPGHLSPDEARAPAPDLWTQSLALRRGRHQVHDLAPAGRRWHWQ